MKSGAPTKSRGVTLGSALGLSGGFFASSAERRLARVVEAGLLRVEAGLLSELSFTDQLADATSRYLLQAGGKRVRPALTLITAQLGDGNTAEVISAAQAIEITHLASLYHDDVMDEAQLRRGVPSAQTVWGNSVAILAGDLLFARAAKITAHLGERGIELQADTFERLCLGQLHETVGPGAGEDPIAHYIQVLADKTGALIAAAARAGVMFANAPEEYLQPVTVFGQKIGVAFQLVDDVIDLSAPVSPTGKTPGTDLRSGVSTLPLLYLARLADSDRDAAALLARLSRFTTQSTADQPIAESGSDDLATAIRELREHNVTRRTLADAHRWAGEAVQALGPLPAGAVKEALTRFAQALVERSS
ncbi:MAG: polyprenyl synthetase family protein [Microbacteriaceae bacterium]